MQPKKKKNNSKLMQRETFMKEEKNEEGEEKTMKTISDEDNLDSGEIFDDKVDTMTAA